MKNKTLLVIFSFLFLIFIAAGDVWADADGLCPLPKEYKVFCKDADEKPNGDTAPNVGGESKKMGDCLHKDNVSDLEPVAETAASFVVQEDKAYNYDFVCTGANGDKNVSTLSKDQFDSTTQQQQFEWQPSHDGNHNPASQAGDDGMPLAIPHYKIKGPKQEGHEWTSPGWKIDHISYVYHMDSPQKYGVCGQIGYNPFESRLAPGEGYAQNDVTQPSKNSFSYFVPSVPINYVVSSALSIRWRWKSSLVHTWELATSHVPDKSGTCTLCRRKATDTSDKKAVPMNVDVEWGPKEICSDIETPDVATGRLDKSGNYYDEDGVGKEEVYKSPAKKFDKPEQPCVVARATVRVKDMYNIAHVQTGYVLDTDGNTNLIKSECGKKISEMPGMKEKQIVIRIVDNCVHATIDTVITNKEKNCKDGKWKDGNFKVTLWYEVPLYQYCSYLSGKWKDNNGEDHDINDVVYSPMFVWKKHKTWNSLSEFLEKDATSLTYGSDKENERLAMDKQTEINPKIIIYEKKIKISDWFTAEGASQEEIMPWHYAYTSQGDSFGNPPYVQGVENKNFGKCLDLGDKSIVKIFKYPPIKFIKGKGPLKYFVEVHDGSELTYGGGNTSDEKEFNCKGVYFRENDYKQGQLVYNPEVYKYIQYSKGAKDIKLDKEADQNDDIDPTAMAAGDQPCLSESYSGIGDDIQPGWMTCSAVTNLLNPNVGDAASVVKNFQAWGMVRIDDTIRPNVGLKIIDTVRGTVRKVYKINDNSTLVCYNTLIKKAGNKWALLDQEKNACNYYLATSAKSPRAPFTLDEKKTLNNEKIWEFKDVQLLISTSDNSKIWEGKDYVGTADKMEDSLAPYGTAEDTKLDLTHQDLKNNNKSNFVIWYAHDNIDGQRVKDGTNVVTDDWYKGVTAFDFNKSFDNESNSSIPLPNKEFADDYINKGYTSWIITDKTYTSDSVFNQMYKNGSYFRYPDVSFNNPNRKWDGSALPNGDQEISVAYGVIDKAGNTRKFKLWFYVAPLDMKIQTLEKHEQRKE